MTMHTRHWIFGIGVPIMGVAQAVLLGFATPDEASMAQANQAQFSIWVGMAIQVAIGIKDWYTAHKKENPEVHA